MEPGSTIVVENLSKVYPLRQPHVNGEGEMITEHWALKNISFEIREGESVGIVGENGSGKSTLLKVLAGVTQPTSGEARIRGRVASVLDIGAGFHQELSGRENVFLNGQILGFSKREIQEQYDEIVSFSGIEKFIEEPVKNYSNGMYLRLAFSIMAHLNFDVYLFDEVLSVGDEDFRKKSFPKINSLINRGKTVVLISHNFSEIATLCSMVYTIHEGRLVMKDTIERFRLSLISKDVTLPYFVERLSVEVKDTNGENQSTFLNSEALFIEINNVYKEDKTDNNIALRLKDNLGSTIFSTSPSLTKEGVAEIDYAGSRKYVMMVPPHYFNRGTFFIDIIYFNEGGIVEEVNNISYFTIRLNPVYKEVIKLGEKGRIRTFFEWKIG